MTPASPTRVWRKTRRKALRGVPAGRRATHEVVAASYIIGAAEFAATYVLAQGATA